MEVSDRELLNRYRDGQISALEGLIAKYRKPLFGFIINMSQGRDDADEIFQEVWLRVIRRQTTYEHGNFCGWLVQIARNVIIDRVRRRKFDLSLDEENEDGSSLGKVIAGNEPEPSARLVSQDLGERISKAVNMLSPEQKEVFLMRVQAGLSFKEIAGIQKVSINTALARMQYALSKLRTVLEKDYEELNKADDKNIPPAKGGRK